MRPFVPALTVSVAVFAAACSFFEDGGPHVVPPASARIGSAANASGGEGDVLYVDVQTGDDGGSGSATDPLRTITAALQLADAGDTIRVVPGDYRGEGTIAVTETGTLQSIVRIERFGAGAVVVDRIDITASTWVWVEGLTITGSKTLPAEWLDMPDVVVDDPSVVIDPDEAWSTRSVKVAQKYATYSQFQSPVGAPSWEIEYFSAGIDVTSSSDITLVGNEVSLHTVGIRLRNSSSRVLVEDNTIHHVLDAIRGDKREIDDFSYEDSTIRANHVTQTFREGIRLTAGARNNLVEGNDVRYSGRHHIATYGAGGGNRITENYVEYGGYYAETMQFPGASAISIHSAGANTVADRNYAAYQYDATLRDGNGFIIDFTPQGVRIANNVVYRSMGSGITSTRSGSSTIVHNTIVEAGYQTASLKNGVGIRMTAADDINSIIANNIFEEPSIGGMLFEAGTLQQQAFVDFNLFHTAGAPLVGNGLQPEDIYWTLDDLRAIGYGLNDVDTHPLLEDPAAGLFTPLPGSLAIGRGTGQHSDPFDAVGTPRSPAAPTIGAYEAPPPAGSDPVILAAGDIASCASTGDEATADLLDTLAGTVLTLGDNAYETGSPLEFSTCYDPTWGRHKSRTMPSVGNHEYGTPGASGYYGYFGAAAGDPSKGYYSYDLGTWHVIALNSNCSAVGGCGGGSTQEQWLRDDLATHPAACTLAYWHHARFSSSAAHGSSTTYQALWQALYDYGADVVLVGHDHDYERFAPQTATGAADAAYGIREFVVGTGGKSHYGFDPVPEPNSEVRDSTSYGVLQMTLQPAGYDFAFLPAAGSLFTDSGSGTCHGALLDPDGDGWLDAQDNCPSIANPGQENADGNFIDQTPPSTQDDRTWPNSDPAGDACDTDDDNDGVADAVEPAGCNGSAALDPANRDSDGDRVLDGVECALGTDPSSPASKPSAAACGSTSDADGDRLSERVEVCGYNTSPSVADTDGDLDGSPTAGLTKDGCEAVSLNNDRVVNAGDQLLLVLEILREPSPSLRLVSFDINKDGAVNAGDQLMVVQLISPTGQCP